MIKKILISRGYMHIVRSAGSHTPIDLIASNGKKLLAIQVKRGRYISAEEKGMLIQWAKAFRASPILARKQEGRWVFHLLMGPSIQKKVEI
jgi:Holliday junction resolvase